mmetsp:Transcript_89081/g.147401  ORF Transcript_89081/g.147401 Transcript_89081/m.147401 type:complete len:451 (-) Transcript_89081:89-1441(-)
MAVDTGGDVAVELPMSTVSVPRCVLREVLEDGCCPLHLRVQLARVLRGNTCGAAVDSQRVETPPCEALLDAGLDGTLDAGCTSAIAAFMSHEDLLATRAAGTEPLCSMMRRPLVEDSSSAVAPSARSQLPGAAELDGGLGDLDHLASIAVAATRGDNELLEVARHLQLVDGPENQGSAAPAGLSALANVHRRIRVRLWLRRLAELTAGGIDEDIFESSVRSFVDDALRRRLEAEVAAAKRGMEGEVRTAKANMLQCVQAISEEVDRRVREKVAALQEEFDRRAGEQAHGLREMVEQRVSEQTLALQAEVNRRTDCVREAVEQRAREQEEAAARLHAEVARIRGVLEERVREQEDVAQRLTNELTTLRSKFFEITGEREALEARVAEQEALAVRLQSELDTLQAACQHLGLPRSALCRGSPNRGQQASPSTSAGGSASQSCCWRGLRRLLG